MATNAVINPYQYFQDFNKGRPIFNGMIYVGKVGLDPEVIANQKDVTFLDACDCPVNTVIMQPIRTSSGGVPIYNGSPIRLFVDGPYSLKVNDSKGVQVYYTPDVTQGVPLTSETAIAVISNIADLRSSEATTNGQQVSVTGYTKDGVGGGLFYYDALDTTSSDNGGTIIVTSGGLRWKRPELPFYTFEMFGAVGDGVSLDQASIDSAVANVNTIRMSDGATYLQSSAINANGKTGFKIYAENDSSSFDVTYGGRCINISGQGNELVGFKIKSTATVAVTSQGLINIDDTVTPSINTLIDGIVFDCPNHGMNGVLAKGQSPNGLLNNTTIKNCKILNIGRMGIEVLSYAKNTDVKNNHINNTGISSSTFGMGISISGNDISRTRVHNNDIGNCPNTCIEIIGSQSAIQVHSNSLFGTNGALIGNTNTNLAVGFSIINNTSEPGQYSILKIHAAADCLMSGNVLYVTRIDVASSGVTIDGNEIYSNSATAITIDNNPKNVVQNNLVDNTASASTNSLIRCFNSGAIINVIQNNKLRKAAGGSYIDNNGGASQNIFKDNEEADTLKPADTMPEALTLSDMSSNTYVKIALLDAIAAGSKRAAQFRVTASGTSNSGADRISGQVMVSVTMKDEIDTFTLISQNDIYLQNMTFAVTMVAGGLNIQVVPTTGSGNQIVWFVENLSGGLPVAQSLISMNLASAP